MGLATSGCRRRAAPEASLYGDVDLGGVDAQAGGGNACAVRPASASAGADEDDDGASSSSATGAADTVPNGFADTDAEPAQTTCRGAQSPTRAGVAEGANAASDTGKSAGVPSKTEGRTAGTSNRSQPVWDPKPTWDPNLNGSDSLIELVREAQTTWVRDHPDLVLKWCFPTKQRGCLVVKFAAAQKVDQFATPEFRLAFGELVRRYPPTVRRVLSYLYLNYLYPHHKRIQAQGRHLMMLKVYEGKNEAHCWYMPLKDVLERHKKSSTEPLDAGPSLNDVQLVQTYVVESTVVFHIEIFEATPGHRENMYGNRTWVGGMALHIILDKDGPGWDKSQKFATVPEGEMAELADKRTKMREKRARKNDSQRMKKEEEQAVQAAEAAEVHEQERAAAAARRREGLLKPHESLTRMMMSGVA